jgi:hypothetical protein
MGWYVEVLLLNKDLIREKTIRNAAPSFEFSGFIEDDEVDFDSDEFDASYSSECKQLDSDEFDEFNDLLLVEKELDNLKINRLLTEEEIKVLEGMLCSANFAIAHSKLGLSRKTIAKIFRRVCNRISYKLGGYFTDEGYLSYLANKYNLTSLQVDTLKSYMNSKLRYSLARQIYQQVPDSTVESN